MAGTFDITYDDDEGILLGARYDGEYVAHKSACRVYYEMYDGLITPQTLTGIWMRLGVGGKAAWGWGDEWRWSIYGRAKLTGRNRVVIARGKVQRYDIPGGGKPPLYQNHAIWRPIDPDLGVRVIVVKLECTSSIQYWGYTGGWDDNAPLGASNPHGIIIRAARVYGSSLRRNLTYRTVLRDIASAEYEPATVATPASSLRIGQLAFRDIPYDRWEAIDDVVEMNGWDYGVWDDDVLSFADPAKAPRVKVPFSHAAVSTAVGPDDASARNAVRVKYTGAKGRPREVVVHGKLNIGDDVVAETISAPDSVRTKPAAIRVGKRWLKEHGRIVSAGTVTVTGRGPWGDALHLRPTVKVGRENVVHVQLRPLEWAATLELGRRQDSFASWLARREAKVRKGGR